MKTYNNNPEAVSLLTPEQYRVTQQDGAERPFQMTIVQLGSALAALVPPPRRPLLAYHGLLGPRGAATLCSLSSKARNLERLGIGDATSWAKRPPLHGLGRSANGVRVEHRGINLPGSTGHHLGGV
jgi:hypothetical protein